MAALSEAIAQYRKSLEPTPLATYLHIYNHSRYESYISYMEGAKALAKYLSPIDIQVSNTTVPQILVSYDLVEIARVLEPHTTIPLSLNQIKSAIYDHLITKFR